MIPVHSCPFNVHGDLRGGRSSRIEFFGLACVIVAVQRPVAADQNNANKEAHSACSVVEKQDLLGGFRA